MGHHNRSDQQQKTFIMIQAAEAACFENQLPCESHLQGLVFDLCVKRGFAKNVQCHLTFRFVYTKCVFGYMHDIGHFVTNEVTTAKRVQTPTLLKNYKTYADLDISA